MSGSALGRVQRLIGGWSANLVQLALGIGQQVVLVPIFLHFQSSATLAAWLAVYAAGNLTLVADVGLHSRAINRFLAFKSSLDADGRTAAYYAAMQRVYFALASFLVALVLIGAFLIHPSKALGFRSVSGFDSAFVVMIASMLLVMLSNLPSGLYRARGHYGRAVWITCAAMLLSQVGQIVAIATTKSLTTITIAYAVPLIMASGYMIFVDGPRLFPFLQKSSVRYRPSWRWIAGQFRRAFPFAVAGSTEVALQNLPVLLVSALVVDRIAVAQWGLTRVAAGLVRMLCAQATLPLAAELGHDHAIGAKQQLRRLYAHGSAFVSLLASLVVSGLLAFWPDFFALWTNDAVPYNASLTVTLLVGAALVAPAMFALGYAYYSDRGALLARSKGLQLIAFLVLSIVLTPKWGPLGTAIAIVATDLVVQFGVLAVSIIWQTLERPARHLLFLAALLLLTTVFGWAVGESIRSAMPWTGLARFVAECALWLAAMALAASPMLAGRMRTKAADHIPS